MRRGSHTESAASLGSKVSEHDEVTTQVMMPLKPPSRPEKPQTSPTNRIIVESPFDSQIQPDTIARRLSVKLVKEQTATSRRNSSIDAKKLFSAPFVVFRSKRERKEKEIPEARPLALSSLSWLRSSTNAQGHKSLLKGDQTAATLQQASAILRGNKRLPIRKLKTWNTRRSPDAGSKSPSNQIESAHSSNGEKVPTFNSPAHRSSRDHQAASTTSSIIDMQMGNTPQNTPVESATYKIKRSPSAETEEYLKVDVSIYGGTSYLPSEARRVHTPPLPGDDTIGHSSRGFFFNYNAPDFTNNDHTSQSSHDQTPQAHHQQSPQSTTTMCLKPPSQDQLIHRVKTKLNIHSLAPALRVPTGKPGLMVKKPKIVSKKTGDWYETRLADVDAASSLTDVSSLAN